MFRYVTYIHMNAACPKKIGDSVKQGELLGYRGNTGNSNGPHLHWGVTDKTSKSYTWNLVKSLAINPMTLDIRKDHNTYYGQMFANMKFIDEDEADELNKLKAEVSALTSKLSTVNAEIERLNAQDTLKTTQLTAANNEINSLKEKINKVKSVVSNL